MNALKQTRAQLKGQLTRFESFLNKIKDLSDNSESIIPEKVREIQNRLDRTATLLNEYENVHAQIMLISEDADVEEAHLNQFEEMYFSLISLAQIFVKKFTENTEIRSGRSSPAQSIHSIHMNNSNSRSYINLPKINLIKFSGNIEGWLEFKAIFNNLIDENEDISDVQRLHYLKGSLTGEAAEVIKSLEFSAANYAIAWQALKSRYDQPKLIIKNHLTSILDLQVQKRESSRDLRKLSDSLFKHISAAKTLATGEQLFETLIVYLVSNKFDPVTFREWETTFNKGNSMVPTLEEFKEFLNNHTNFLENLERRLVKVAQDKPKNQIKAFVTNNSPVCSLCKGNHFISRCEEFINLTPQARTDKVQNLKVCFNCLCKGHGQAQCSSRFTCRSCKAKHHSLLHVESQRHVTTAVPLGTADATATPPSEPTQIISALCSTSAQILLPTASAKILDSSGNCHSIRILLDSGSQSNFIRSDVCRRLNLFTQEANISVFGLSNSSTHIRTRCDLEVSAHHSQYRIKLSCLVIDQITGSVPSFSVQRSKLKLPDNIQLSDPSFDQPGQIDLLIGSPVFFELLCVGQIRLGPSLPILQKTRFGWIVSGPTSTNSNGQVHCLLSTSSEVEDQLAKFWAIDSYPIEKVFSPEENACETHYHETTRRDTEGRFIVSIPFKQPSHTLGDSSVIARKRFLALERRLQANPNLNKRYCEFMKEYLDLGHMSEVNPTCEPSTTYYLPHHGVLKEDSLTTKLRVVFNGSSATTTGHSLNSIQMVGPTIQQDLFTILIRFRQHRYAISADIEKMYRQVQVELGQRPLQRILWRFSPDGPIKTYNLNTVTYGTASAPYLAIRSLTQLGIDCENSLPDISQVIKQDFYVDDLLTGAASLEKARDTCLQLTKVLSSGCFNLRKWISNSPEVLADIPHSDVHPGVLEFGDHEHARTLGLIWSFQTDHFMFSISNLTPGKVTKRKMLSEIAQIFDPLGLLTPCTFVAKVFLQGLWLEKLDWDDSVPVDMEKRWISYRNDLVSINELKIPRHVTCANPIEIQIHGFCDASINGYGACIYFRATNANNQVYVNLLCAKSKVAPLKPTTIPKLELCGAVLLSKLLQQILKAIKLPIYACFLWSDSTIVLGWLKTSPNLLTTFVCNRVADIQNITSNAVWRHVPTKCNPADLLSRGTTPQLLKTSTLWWNGPPWLFEDESTWPNPKFCPVDLPELKRETQSFATVRKDSFSFESYSNLTRLERVIAYCLRFRKNCSASKTERSYGPLTPMELRFALQTLIKISQLDSFLDEQKQLVKSTPLKASSSLISLNPFIDSDELMRVGGRLRNSKYSFDKKHPFLISGKHHLARLIAAREHVRLLHAGPQLLLSSLRDRFWITSGRNVVKQIVHQCIKCFRLSPTVTQPIMGNLPAERVQPSFPFAHTGIDYGGPILIKDRKGRGSKISKTYLCLYVCFATKAVHLELVTNLSTESFILSFRRFVARRGKPLHVHSDNGTNFVGANSELRELGKFLRVQESSIPEIVACEGINWHFIPAHSPHFGGLWEAGIKSCKHHLTRVIGNAIFTYEELCTLLSQVEAIMNSRPIAPLSSDPNDLQPLTPGHFLVGRPLTALPDPDVTHIAENRLGHFQKIQSLHQHLWKRWSKEYISEMQQRVKWKTHHSELTTGSLALIKDDNLPPLKWRLGRVINLHPGSDGINRVATLQTSNGTVRRSFAKICPLPSA